MHVRLGDLLALFTVFAAMTAAGQITHDPTYVIGAWLIGMLAALIVCRWWYGSARDCRCPSCREIRAELAEKEQG